MALQIYLQRGVRWRDVVEALEERGFIYSRRGLVNAINERGLLHVPDGHDRCGHCKSVFPVECESSKKRGAFCLCPECKAEGQVLPQHSKKSLAQGQRGPKPKWSRHGSFYA